MLYQMLPFIGGQCLGHIETLAVAVIIVVIIIDVIIVIIDVVAVIIAIIDVVAVVHVAQKELVGNCSKGRRRRR